MGHDHHHHHHHHHYNDTTNIGLAFWLNLLFTVVELVGGIFTNSLAILSDAVHDLGDSIALGLAWYFQKKSNKGRNKKYTYGYQRFSLVGAIMNSIILLLGSVYIISNAIPRLIEPQVSNAKGMFFLAFLGIAVNGFAAYRLSLGSSHNEKVVSLHMIEDLLGWVAVLIGSVVIYFTGWFIIDPILSIMIALFIMYNVFKNTVSTINIILQATPENIDHSQIVQSLNNIKGVQSHHDLHLWSLDGQNNVLTAHLVLDETVTNDQISSLKVEVKAAMAALDIHHCTLEFEAHDEACESDCELNQLDQELNGDVCDHEHHNHA